jgi:hypothetical protein
MLHRAEAGSVSDRLDALADMGDFRRARRSSSDREWDGETHRAFAMHSVASIPPGPQPVVVAVWAGLVGDNRHEQVTFADLELSAIALE